MKVRYYHPALSFFALDGQSFWGHPCAIHQGWRAWDSEGFEVGERGVQKDLRKVIYVKYQIKDQDLFDKAYGYIKQYY